MGAILKTIKEAAFWYGLLDKYWPQLVSGFWWAVTTGFVQWAEVMSAPVAVALGLMGLWCLALPFILRAKYRKAPIRRTPADMAMWRHRITYTLHEAAVLWSGLHPSAPMPEAEHWEYEARYHLLKEAVTFGRLAFVNADHETIERRMLASYAATIGPLPEFLKD